MAAIQKGIEYGIIPWLSEGTDVEFWEIKVETANKEWK